MCSHHLSFLRDSAAVVERYDKVYSRDSRASRPSRARANSAEEHQCLGEGAPCERRIQCTQKADLELYSQFALVSVSNKVIRIKV